MPPAASTRVSSSGAGRRAASMITVHRQARLDNGSQLPVDLLGVAVGKAAKSDTTSNSSAPASAIHSASVSFTEAGMAPVGKPTTATSLCPPEGRRGRTRLTHPEGTQKPPRPRNLAVSTCSCRALPVCRGSSAGDPGRRDPARRADQQRPTTPAGLCGLLRQRDGSFSRGVQSPRSPRGYGDRPPESAGLPGPGRRRSRGPPTPTG